MRGKHERRQQQQQLLAVGILMLGKMRKQAFAILAFKAAIGGTKKVAKYLIRAHVPPPLPPGQIGLREREVQAGSREIGFLEPLIKPQCMPQHPISFFA